MRRPCPGVSADARKLVFATLEEAVNDPAATLEVFAFDLDEPDVIRRFAALGPRLRIFLDDAPIHTKAGSSESQARALLAGSAGADHVTASSPRPRPTQPRSASLIKHAWRARRCGH